MLLPCLQTGVNPELLLAAQKAKKKQKEKANCSSNSPLKICAKYEKQGVTHEVLSLNHTEEEKRNGQLMDRHSDSDLEEAVFLERLSSIHSIILDWTAASFIDSVGAKAIKQVIKEYAAVDIQVVIAGCSRSLLSELDALQFFSGVVTTEMAFPTVHDAVLHCLHSHTRPAATNQTT